MPDETSDFPGDDLLQTLSAALARATGSYEEFSSRIAPDSAKDFTAHHNACKAALAHLGAVIKLYHLWQKHEPKTNADDNENTEFLLRQARDTLLLNKEKMNDRNDQEDQF